MYKNYTRVPGALKPTSSTTASDRDGEKRPMCYAPRLVVAKHR